MGSLLNHASKFEIGWMAAKRKPPERQGNQDNKSGDLVIW
jgi:hypothetical protein